MFIAVFQEGRISSFQGPNFLETMSMYNVYVWYDTANNHRHVPSTLKLAKSRRGDARPNSKEAKCEDLETFVYGPLCLSSYFPKPNVIFKNICSLGAPSWLSG